MDIHTGIQKTVSIHARARRATSLPYIAAVRSIVSIHARARRATRERSSSSIMQMFQSTPARGGRQQWPHGRKGKKCFNPRPREAGDLDGFECSGDLAGFNPRPREAGDSFIYFFNPIRSSFNPRPREAGDIFVSPLVGLRACFNPRPREAGDFYLSEMI